MSPPSDRVPKVRTVPSPPPEASLKAVDKAPPLDILSSVLITGQRGWSLLKSQGSGWFCPDLTDV